jgi:hypothetical protein
MVALRKQEMAFEREEQRKVEQTRKEHGQGVMRGGGDNDPPPSPQREQYDFMPTREEVSRRRNEEAAELGTNRRG